MQCSLIDFDEDLNTDKLPEDNIEGLDEDTLNGHKNKDKKKTKGNHK
jgi:hypothetical protein